MHFFTRKVALIASIWLVSGALTAAENGHDVKVEVQPDGLPKKVAFKAKTLYEHAAYLASDACEGRMAGSPGEAKAREYIIKRLKKSGFENVWRQEFDFIADVKIGRENAFGATFHLAPAQRANEGWYRKPNPVTKPNASGESANWAGYAIDNDYRPLRISQSKKIENAPLVFAGYGISAPDKGYDDYKDLDVKGKVVLILRYEPETPEGRRIGNDKPDPHAPASVFENLSYKAAVARDKGAAAVVFVNGKRGISAAERATLEAFDRGGGGRLDCGIPFVQIFPEVANDWLRGAKKDLDALQSEIDAKLTPRSFGVPGVTISLNVDVQRVRAVDENLAVAIPGCDPKLKDEIVVIGAHYDHLGRGNEFSLAPNEMGKIHRGADDNASGVASVLELAGALNKNRAALKRTVWIMFFGAEELGTLGSNHFIRTPPPEFPIPRVAAMLNLDMVGRTRNHHVNVYGVATGSGFEDILKTANAELKLDIKATPDGFGGSDQTAFVTAGIPVLFFFTGAHEDYHKPSDTADKLNVGAQAAISALVFNAAVALINAPERPKFVKVESQKMGGFPVVLSVLPDYSYEGKGLRLTNVKENGAAQRAGLKANDVIVSLGGKKIENIQDYMNALRQLVAGVEAPVSVLRDGKPLELKITPEKR